MPSYSRNPFPYAENGKQQWDDETKKVTLERQPHTGSLSSNGKYLALGIDHVIHIIDTQSWDTIAVLRGHTNKVEALAFRADRSDVLVSSEEQVYDDSGNSEPPKIILWNIEEEKSAPRLSDDQVRNASQAALSAAADKLAEAGINLSKDELRHLDVTVGPADATTGEQKYKFKTEGQNWAGVFSPDSSYFAATDGQSNVWVYSLADGGQHWVYKGQRSDRWRRTLAWHPTNPWLAVGGESNGELLLLDIMDKESRDMMEGFVGTLETRFFDAGNKLAVWAFGDWSIEVYDLKQEVKWRFARGGTEDGPNAGKWRNEQGKVTSKGGYEMLAWEDHSKGSLFLASIDFDAVRFWEVPLTA
ncbi:related to serine/threonine-protein kinase pkwA [Fusarium fujikuroi]|nr:related to serine/threonine-protein kinase pkwA [Fusarium fujikuroi]